MTETRFTLGHLVAAPGGLIALAEAGQTPRECLARHQMADWGDLDDEDDRRENERSLQAGSRLLSAYRLRDGTKIWVITEANRTGTTLLLPSEN